jgi:hypothetical protein
MIDPDYLLWAPHEELTHRARGAPNQTFLRRAVSNFYYAVFHEICRQVADQHVGAALRTDPRYPAVYRSIEHGRARQVCERASKSATSSRELVKIATAFVNLQDARHAADYDPSEKFYVSDARLLFLEAEGAIEAIRTEFADKKLFLTRLLVRERAAR